MQAYFYGELIQGEELDKLAKKRKKECQEITVQQAQQPYYEEKGWKLKRRLKQRVRLQKRKKCDELLEDEVWLLFKNLGFIEMNKDRNFKIQAGPIRKQIDVFAKDKNNIFVIECKAQSREGPRTLRKDIHEILNSRRDIIKSIRGKYGMKFRFSFLLVTKNIIWESGDERLAIDNRKNGFFFWKEREFEAYRNLVTQLGEDAKFQMYSLLFRGKKIHELEDIQMPAIYGGKGKSKYYSFIIQPEKLLQVAYVHRREESDVAEVSGTYQRMVNKTRLKKICEFIDQGGFFPNNIILNFTEKPIFERKDRVGDIIYGILKFPKYYGSAWVIDGQHRLFGYSKTGRKSTDTLPVVAFVELEKKDQANLFVEINKEQKAVTSNLLWDLYSDIYKGVMEEKYQLLWAISAVVRKLDVETDSPFHNNIYIPSIPKKPTEIANLTMANICDGLKDNKLINEEERLLYEKSYEHTVDFANERVKAYFDVIKKSFPQDWKMGDKGLLRTNIGARIFLIILRQFLRYLKYKGLEEIYRKKDLSQFKDAIRRVLSPVLARIEELSDEEKTKIRGETARGRVMYNAQQMTWWIKEKYNEFGLEILRTWAPQRPKEASDESIRSLLQNTEPALREFIIKKLEKKYGAGWWRKGIPQGARDEVTKKIEAQIQKEPWRKGDLSTLSAERKFKAFTDTPFLREVIQYPSNWERFREIFVKDKEYTLAKFKDFEFIRHKYQHFAEHECDDISKNLGYWSMMWIRRCMGLNDAKR